MVNGLVSILVIFVTFVCGVILGKACDKKPKTDNAGNIVINTTDPDKDTIRIELGIPISSMASKESVTFNVVNEDG